MIGEEQVPAGLHLPQQMRQDSPVRPPKLVRLAAPEQNCAQAEQNGQGNGRPEDNVVALGDRQRFLPPGCESLLHGLGEIDQGRHDFRLGLVITLTMQALEGHAGRAVKTVLPVASCNRRFYRVHGPVFQDNQFV